MGKKAEGALANAPSAFFYTPKIIFSICRGMPLRLPNGAGSRKGIPLRFPQLIEKIPPSNVVSSVMKMHKQRIPIAVDIAQYKCDNPPI